MVRAKGYSVKCDPADWERFRDLADLAGISQGAMLRELLDLGNARFRIGAIDRAREAENRAHRAGEPTAKWPADIAHHMVVLDLEIQHADRNAKLFLDQIEPAVYEDDPEARERGLAEGFERWLKILEDQRARVKRPQA